MNPFRSIQNEREVRDQSFPVWLGLFLETLFYGPCGIHACFQNELRYYCIDCNASACKHCVHEGSHQEHKLLKVYRHVYKEAVLQEDVENLFDCAHIQAYRCNKKMVLTLTPIAHSGSQTTREGSCHTCMRKLYDPDANRYCSITCKVQASVAENNMQSSNMQVQDSATENNGEDMPVLPVQGQTLSYRKKPRKGIPHRAADP